jgi:hypothetical protein
MAAVGRMWGTRGEVGGGETERVRIRGFGTGIGM